MMNITFTREPWHKASNPILIPKNIIFPIIHLNPNKVLDVNYFNLIIKVSHILWPMPLIRKRQETESNLLVKIQCLQSLIYPDCEYVCSVF